MRSRKVVKMKKSLYINIPSDTAEALEIRKGDRWRVENIPGTGLLITPERGSKKVELNIDSIERIQRAADMIYSQQEKRLRSLESNIIANIVGRLIPVIAGSGIFDIKAGLKKTQAELRAHLNRSAKIHLLKKRVSGER